METGQTQLARSRLQNVATGLLERPGENLACKTFSDPSQAATFIKYNTITSEIQQQQQKAQH